MTDRKTAVLPTAEQVRSAFDYDPATGALIWRHRPEMPAKWNGRYAGKVAGTRNWAGYTQTCINYRYILAHRLVWMWHHGEWPPEHIDHINGVVSDNRIENLRPATTAQNGWNSGRKAANTSGFKGVSKCSRTERWIATIRAGGAKRIIGRFSTPEEAGAAYRAAAERLHGAFARTD